MSKSSSKALATLAKSTTNSPAVIEQPAPTIESWSIVGQPSKGKNAVNGIGPAPGPKTVGHAALTRIGKDGATVKEIQDAVAAVGLKGKHPVGPLLRWLAKERGYSFVCTNGLVKMG